MPRFLLLLLLLVTSNFVAHATPRPGFIKSKIHASFQIPAGIKPAVKFWSDIYSIHSRHQVVLHDRRDLGIIYETLDLSDLGPLGNPFAAFPPEIQKARQERVRAAQQKIVTALVRLAEDPGREDITRYERSLVQLLRGLPGGPEKYQLASENVRSQTGLKDRFAAGIALSGRYLSVIEDIFREEHVPWELTRLVFVESMFDLRAYSHVGASGIWQFMPGTATLMGLARNAVIDERNDPLAASHAAARLLKKNYADLGTWPLAVNAYNAGVGRLRQAVRALGTNNIATIIQRFQHPGYQFASRNFYPEFLAALHVFENRSALFGKIALTPPLQYDTIVTSVAVPLPELAETAGVPLQTIWDLNPGYTSTIYQGNTPLPAGYVLKIPPRSRHTFVAALAELGKSS